MELLAVPTATTRPSSPSSLASSTSAMRQHDLNTPSNFGLPYPPYLRTVATRSIALWILLELLIIAFEVVTDLPVVPIPTFGLPAVFVWLDRTQAREHLL